MSLTAADVAGATQPWLEEIRRRLPPGAAIDVCSTRAPPPVLPEERSLTARAVPRRRDEFSAGRAAARRALARVGAPPAAILAHDAGDPVWPPGLVGSISHAGEWAIAVVAPSDRIAALGIDLEDDAPLDADLVAQVCLDGDMARLAEFQRAGLDLPKLCFAAKEAAYKAVFPQARTFMDFDDVALTFDPARRDFVALFRGAPAPIRGIFAHDGGLVCALCFS
jgi:4'-phosphopantetheinyl transferase EntD